MYKTTKDRYRKIVIKKQQIEKVLSDLNKIDDILDKVIYIENNIIMSNYLSSLLKGELKPASVYDLLIKFIFCNSLAWLEENLEFDSPDVIKFKKFYHTSEFCINMCFRFYTSKTPYEFLQNIELAVPLCIKVELYKTIYEQRERKPVNVENLIKKFVSENYGNKNNYDILDEFVTILSNAGVEYDKVIKYKQEICSVFCPKTKPLKISTEQYLKWKEDTNIKVEKYLLRLLEEEDELELLTKAIKYVQEQYLPENINTELYCRTMAKRYLNKYKE